MKKTKESGMKMKTKMYRQGDVLVVSVESIETGLADVPQDNGKTVLAYGEVTGHSHALKRGKLYRRDAMTQLLDINVKDFLRHEEHGEILIGEPQKPTARNAVASTFGMRGEEYRPEVET